MLYHTSPQLYQTHVRSLGHVDVIFIKNIRIFTPLKARAISYNLWTMHINYETQLGLPRPWTEYTPPVPVRN